jgi:cell division protein FtsZ
MQRRQVLHIIHAMGASLALPASAFRGEGASVITQVSAQTLDGPEAAGDIPRVGIMAVGGFGCAVLSDLAGRIPYLNRSIAMDTDASALHRAKADRKILVGDGDTLPLNHQAAQRLAQSSLREIAASVAGLDMVLLVAGMGGAAGTGIAPVVAQMLRDRNILTVAFATLPFNAESLQRKLTARAGIRALRVHAHALLPFANGNAEQAAKTDALFTSAPSQASLAFNQLCRGILNPACRPSLVNIDFEDLRHIITGQAGDCAFGFGSCSSMNGAEAATRHAIDHPLLGQHRLQRASAVLIAIGASRRVLMLRDSMTALRSIRKHLSPDASIIYGTAYDDTLGDEITVSVLASGIPNA